MGELFGHNFGDERAGRFLVSTLEVHLICDVSNGLGWEGENWPRGRDGLE